MDEGYREHIGGDEGRCTSAREEGASGGQWRGRVKARRGSRENQCLVAVMEGSDVVLPSRCTIKKLVRLNERMNVRQREAVRGTTLAPFLEYPDIGMERHLTLELIKCWVPQWKAFRVGGRRVPFSVFDIALLTGLLAIGHIRMGEYNWAQAVWRVVVDTIEDTQKKLCAGPLIEVQLNGFCLLNQVRFN
ncbi:hypothetical protein Cgig2_011990 [Carnegiea gigantea]|uniref:Uncharacterized protein n=1 Tax=Carnegiea gigantea TaxID=171969 RepID=A0A9Q1QPR3_9CARY|nr:hypothetical protein Cgig2_011990 [Carnegiea gigantea]